MNEKSNVLKTAYENILHRNNDNINISVNGKYFLVKKTEGNIKLLNEFLGKARVQNCEHIYPDGRSSKMAGCGMNICMLCNWDDY